MFAFKSPFVTISLVLITIIHQFRAPPVSPLRICINLIKEEFYFQNSETDGLSNFQNAYQYLSLKRLDEAFKTPAEGDEPPDVKQKRLFQRDITRSYFHSFFQYNKFDFISQFLTPDQWCERRVTEVNFDPEINENEEEMKTDCLEFTTKLLRNKRYQDNPLVIFKTMYEDWSYNDLRSLACVSTGASESDIEQDILEKKLMFKVMNYSEEYFNYYKTAFDVIDSTHGQFLSIKEYCQFVGYHEVKLKRKGKEKGSTSTRK